MDFFSDFFKLYEKWGADLPIPSADVFWSGFARSGFAVRMFSANKKTAGDSPCRFHISGCMLRLSGQLFYFMRRFAVSIHSGIFCLRDSNPYFSVSLIWSRTERLSRFLSSFLKYSLSFRVRLSFPFLSTLSTFALTICPLDKN